MLARFGLRRIGDLLDIPRALLVARFRKDEVALRLDQALGRDAEALTPIETPPRYRAVIRLAAPILEAQQIEHWLERLTDRLAARLRGGSVGARHLRFVATRVDGETSGFELRFAAPTRAPEHMLRLARDHIERIEPGFGIDALRLEALLAEPLAADQGSFVRSTREARDRLAFADLVANRLGPTSVYRLRPVASHIPERACRRRPPDADVDGEAVAAEAPRPLLLLDPPEPVEGAVAEVPDGPPVSFVWRRVRHRVLRAAGPERIAPEWWRLRPRERPRDYFIVECEAGRRFWLFRHGLFDEGEPPTWHMHGLLP
jgi:protein ImuB